MGSFWTRLAGPALLLALALVADPAAARWRVVGPGIAVGDAEAGRGSLSVECDDGLALAAYGFDLDDGARFPVELVVDGSRHELQATVGGPRTALSGEDGREVLSQRLREELSGGVRAIIDGGPLSGLPRAHRTFSLQGSGSAIGTIAAECR